MLYIELLGQIRISWGTERCPIRLKRQSILLLGYFAISRAHREAREVLIARFWPEADTDKGRSNLSSALARLRHGLRPAGPTIISLDDYGQAGIAGSAPVWFDADALRAAARTEKADIPNAIPRRPRFFHSRPEVPGGGPMGITPWGWIPGTCRPIEPATKFRTISV